MFSCPHCMCRATSFSPFRGIVAESVLYFTSVRFINPTHVSSGNLTIFHTQSNTQHWIAHINEIHQPDRSQLREPDNISRQAVLNCPHHRLAISASLSWNTRCHPLEKLRLHPPPTESGFWLSFNVPEIFFYGWISIYLICQKYGIITAQENSTPLPLMVK